MRSCGRCLEAVEVQLALRTVLLWSWARPLEEKCHTRGGKLEDEDEEAGETRVAWMEWLSRGELRRLWTVRGV